MSLNPGGYTAAERHARDLIRTALSSPECVEVWRVAYLAALAEGNPVILRDYADRVGGKAIERVELSTVEASSHALLSLEELRAVARAQLAAERAGLTPGAAGTFET